MDVPLASREAVLHQIPGHDAVLIISHSNFVNSQFLDVAGTFLSNFETNRTEINFVF